jgi:hypothetical protein
MDDDRVKEKDQTGRTVGFLSAKVTHGTRHETAYTRSRIPGDRFIENKVLRRIFIFMRQEVSGGRKTPHNEILHVISGSHGGEYEDGYLLSCSALYSGMSLPTF